jgi:hypothetical protein
LKEFEIIILTNSSKNVSFENFNAMTEESQCAGRVLVPEGVVKKTLALEEGEW